MIKMMEIVHRPVLKEEIWNFLKPDKPNELMVDTTLGEGGHAEFFLKRSPTLRVVGLDADETILNVAKSRLAPFKSRLEYYHTWFNNFFQSYPLKLERPDIILFDLGISTFHFEKSGRGFSFNKNETLDMRLDEDLEISAFDIVNSYPQKELAEILFRYGEERYSTIISRAIVRERRKGPIETTEQLKELIRGAVPAKYRYGRIHPATRTFQALRIAVNGELVRLEMAILNAIKILKVGGKIGVVSFHSLEDRIVKNIFREKSKTCKCPPEQPVCTCRGGRIIQVLTKKPIRPTEEEIRENPSCRSARFRAALKRKEEEL